MALLPMATSTMYSPQALSLCGAGDHTCIDDHECAWAKIHMDAQELMAAQPRILLWDSPPPPVGGFLKLGGLPQYELKPMSPAVLGGQVSASVQSVQRHAHDYPLLDQLQPDH